MRKKGAFAPPLNGVTASVFNVHTLVVGCLEA